MKQELEILIEKIKIESRFHKFLTEDFIYQLIDFASNDTKKKKYSNDIINPLAMALLFYKSYNTLYYKMILEAIKDKKIVISHSKKKAFMDTKENQTFINLQGNDSDLFVIVHECAHFIDRNSNPIITPNQYHFLCEVFSFYIEKKLELWLDSRNELHELVQTRKNNRMYFEEKMLKDIEYELFLEKQYKETGQIDRNNLDSKKVKIITSYDYDSHIGFVNYLLRYLCANILSSYLVDNSIINNDYDIVKVCLNTNLYHVIEKYKTKKRL